MASTLYDATQRTASDGRSWRWAGRAFFPGWRLDRTAGEIASSEPRQFAALFARVTLSGIALLAATNWLVNPWRLYSPRILPPRVLDMRGEKCALLRRAPAPEQLVLGSSRMLRFEPVVLQRQTGLRTFNTAVTDAKAVDSIALYRYAAETLRAPVRSVLLGVETHTFVNVGASYAALESHPELRRFLPAGSRRALSVATRLLSRAQAEDSWASLLHAVSGPRSGAATFRLFSADGYERWRRTDSLPPAERAGFREQVDRALVRSHAVAGDVDLLGVRDLERLLVLLRERGVRTTVVATPMLESMRASWRRSGFVRNEQRALAETRRLCRLHGARFVDFHRPEHFDADPAEFYDAVHPTALTTRRMIEAMFPSAPAAARTPEHPNP